MKVELEDILNDLDSVCLCPECGEVMSCYSHFCESCKERVAVPIDAHFWINYLKKKYGVMEDG